MIRLTPLKTIRVFCLDCAGGSPKEVRHCESKGCALYPFRFGTNPNRKGVGPGRIIWHQKTVSESAEIVKEKKLGNDQKDLTRR